MNALFKDGKFVGTGSDDEADVALANGSADCSLPANDEDVARLSNKAPTLGQRLQRKINCLAHDLDGCATDLLEKAKDLTGVAKDKASDCYSRIKEDGEEALEQLRTLVHEATAPEAPTAEDAEEVDEVAADAPVVAPAEDVPPVDAPEEEIPTE